MRDVVDVAVFGVIAGTIYALIALSIVLTYRGSKVLNFALGEIGTLGLFVTWALRDRAGVPYLPAAVLGIGTAIALGIAFEWLVVRPMMDAERLAVAVATVGLGLAILAIEEVRNGPTPRALPPAVHGVAFHLDGVPVTWAQVQAFAGAVVVTATLTLLLRRSDFGLAVLAAAQDPAAVRLVGAPLWKVSSFTWGAGSGLAVVAALLYEPTVAVFEPGFGSRLFVYGLIAAVVGGLTDLRGALAGGLVVGLLEATAKQINVHLSVNSGLPTAAVAGALLLVLLLRPSGLVGAGRR